MIFPGWGSIEELYLKLDLSGDFIYWDKLNYFGLSEKTREYDEVIFIAWSMGTLVAINALEEIDPDKIVLLAPTLDFLIDRDIEEIEEMLVELDEDKCSVIKKFSMINFFKKRNAVKYVREYEEGMKKLDKEVLKNGLLFLAGEVIDRQLIMYSKKVLILLGEKDRVISIKNSSEVVRKFSNLKVEILKDIGHNMIYECNKISEIVGRFLND